MSGGDRATKYLPSCESNREQECEQDNKNDFFHRT